MINDIYYQLIHTFMLLARRRESQGRDPDRGDEECMYVYIVFVSFNVCMYVCMYVYSDATTASTVS